MAEYGKGQQQLSNISRKRAFADMLRKQGQELGQGLGQTQMVSGWAVPNSGMASANAIISQLLGAYMGNKYAGQEQEAKEQQMREMQDWAQALMRTQEEAQFSPVEQQEQQLMPEMAPQQETGMMSPVPQQPQQQLMPEMAAQGADQVYAQPLTGNERMAHLLKGGEIGGMAAKIAEAQMADMLGPKDPVALSRGAQLVDPRTGDIIRENPFVSATDQLEYKPLGSTPGVFHRGGRLYTPDPESGNMKEITPIEAQEIAYQQKLAMSGGAPRTPDGRILGPMEIADREQVVEAQTKLPDLKRKIDTGTQALELIGRIDEDRFKSMAKQIVKLGDNNWAESILTAAFLNDDERQLAATLKRMALEMRQPGSGQISDFEQKIFQSAAGDQATWSKEALIGNIENAFMDINMTEYNDIVGSWNKYAGDDAKKDPYDYDITEYIPTRGNPAGEPKWVNVDGERVQIQPYTNASGEQYFINVATGQRIQ